MAAAAWFALAAGAVQAGAGAAPAACAGPGACVATLPAGAAAGSPCEGQVVQVFRRPEAPAALQCGSPGGADEPLVLLFNPAQPGGALLLHEGGRVVLQLDGLAEAGVPDRFARHPLCPAARQAAAARPDRLPGRLVVLRKVPAEPYCYELRVASLSRGAPVLRAPGGPPEPVLPAPDRQAWQALLAAAAKAGNEK